MGELSALGIEPVLLDLARPEESAAWTSRPGAVVYAVAAGKGDPALSFRDGPVACARNFRRADRFIHVSTTGVHAQSDGSAIDEESPAEPLEERPRLIREAEARLLDLAGRGESPALVLRMGGLYGPGRSPVEWLRRPAMRQRILRGGREAFMSWVRVEDAAAAVALGVEKGRPGEVYIIADDEPVRRGDFYRFAAERAGLPPPDLPSRPDDLGKRCSNRKARAELGFAPRFPTYREGLSGEDMLY
jgi:nucleoside-diphosphate-sugar epimerase